MNSTPSHPDIAGAVLAGGQASRYGGVAKGMLSLPSGQTMIDRIVYQITSAGIDPIVIMANDAAAYARCGCRILPDRVPDQGPLEGIAAALEHFRHSHKAVLFMPCDLPGIMTTQIDTLLDAFERQRVGAVAARTDSSLWHPLCSVVGTDLFDAIDACVGRPGSRSVGRLWRELGVRPIDFADSNAFFNVNTPEQMAEWQAVSGDDRL